MPNIYPNSQPQPYYGVNGKLTDDAKALPVPKKVFILDKSVLLYSPYAVFAFDEHTVTIPFNVIRDLDAIKKSQGESSRNAQEACRLLKLSERRVTYGAVYRWRTEVCSSLTIPVMKHFLNLLIAA